MQNPYIYIYQYFVRHKNDLKCNQIYAIFMSFVLNKILCICIIIFSKNDLKCNQFIQISCHRFWNYVYIYIYHDSLRYKNILGNATHPCKFHVIGSEIIYIYICVCVCVHTLFLHAVVHVDESSSVFPLVHQEISSVFLICLIILLKGFDQFWSVYHKKCFPPISSFCCLVHQLSQVFPIYFSSWSL